MHRSLAIALSVITPFTTGCAYLTTYTKAIDLENGSYALDMKQRVVVSKERLVFSDEPALPNRTVRISEGRVICTEPSPDALTAISTSLGADFTSSVAGSGTRNASRSNPEGQRNDSASASETGSVGGQIVAALTEQAAYVGIRTPALQTMRDSLFVACQAYANGASTAAEYAAFVRRHQSTMLGLLAIEQMTRPLVTAPVGLSGSAGVYAGLSTTDAALKSQQDRLDKVLADKAVKEGLLAAARGEASQIDADLARKRAAQKEAREQAANSEPDAGKKKAAGDAKAAEFDDAIGQLVAKKNVKEGEVVTLKAVVEGLNSSLQKAETDYKVAQSRVSAVAAGRVDTSRQDEQSFTATSQVAKQIALVVDAINKSYLRDHCFTLVSEMVRQPDKFKEKEPAPKGTFDRVKVITTTLQICNAVLLEQAPGIAATKSSETPTSLREEVGREIRGLIISK